MRNIIIVSHDGDLYNFAAMAGIRVIDWKQEFALMAVYERWQSGYLLYHGSQEACRGLLARVQDRMIHEGDSDFPLVIDLREML